MSADDGSYLTVALLLELAIWWVAAESEVLLGWLRATDVLSSCQWVSRTAAGQLAAGHSWQSSWQRGHPDVSAD